MDTGHSLRLEAATLRPDDFHVGPPFLYPASLTPKVRAFREKLQRFTETHAGEALDREWLGAVSDSFVYSATTEWNSFESGKQGLIEWWALLANAQPAAPHLIADLSLQMTFYFLLGWVKDKPEDSLLVLQDAHRRFYADASASAQHTWRWWVARSAETFQRQASRLPADRRVALLAQALRLLDAYTADGSIPLAHRTYSLVARARTVYSNGDPASAARLLDEWLRECGGQITLPEFYDLRFCVAIYGQADRATARAMVQRATRLAAAGVISAKNGGYDSMLRGYYKQLLSSNIELKRKAHDYVLERTARARQIATHAPTQ